jgi:hypothetical protein
MGGTVGGQWEEQLEEQWEPQSRVVGGAVERPVGGTGQQW